MHRRTRGTKAKEKEQKFRQWSAKHYTENKRLHNQNPKRNRKETQVLRVGMHLYIASIYTITSRKKYERFS
jgi:hypothetical protein